MDAYQSSALSEDSSLCFLANELTMNGYSVSLEPNRRAKVKEYALSFTRWDDDRFLDDTPVVTLGFCIPPEAFGRNSLAFKGGLNVKYGLVRWFDGDKFANQTILILPIRGFMDGNLGASTVVGCGGRMVSHKNVDKVFSNKMVSDALRLAKHRGFVTMLCDDHGVWEVQGCIPWYGFYAVCELITGNLVPWFVDGTHKLYECWTVGQLVSLPPYPSARPTGTRIKPVTIPTLSTAVERHFWHKMTTVRRTMEITSPLVGVATAWGKSVGDCCRRVLTTCNNLQVPSKQYRTDLEVVLRRQYAEVSSLLLPELGDIKSCPDDGDSVE
jgi:hypothetical protein